MKKLLAAGLLFIFTLSSYPAFASGQEVNKLLSDTRQDFYLIKTTFEKSYPAELRSWKAVRRATGFDIGDFNRRLGQRRLRIRALKTSLNNRPGDRDSLKMLNRLDSLEASLFSLVQDYTCALKDHKNGCLQTADNTEDLIEKGLEDYTVRK